MGPLIPQGFVNPELNLFFAFVIGLGFGYVLEQAGFSSSRKLAGVFYGYDFVVLRVFFTAAVTAMTGLIAFNYLGWVNYDLLYINPFYLWSALIGGVIMGFGFILGGFCPGTSLVAAIIGRIDAWFFVLGSMIGIFFFGHFYQLFEGIFTGYFLGNPFVFESLGLSRSAFALLLIAVAIMAFFVTQIIEDKVNGISEKERKLRPSYWVPAVIVLFIGLLFLVLPQQPRSKWYETSAQSLLSELVQAKHVVGVDEVGYNLINPEARPMLLVDVRPAEAYTAFALPGAINMPKEKILQPAYVRFLEEADRDIVFYSYGSTDASEVWLLARRAGFEQVFIMEGGLNNFFAYFFEEEDKEPSYKHMDIYQARFRERARNYFREGKATPKVEERAVPVTKIVEIEMPPGGGC